MFKSDDVKKGVLAIWNSSVEEADAIFSKEKDTNARYALHYAENLWFWAFITDNKSLQKDASIRLKNSKKIASAHYHSMQKLKGKDPDVLNQQIESLLIYGECILFHAFHQMSATFDYAKACLNLSKSWGYIQDAEKLSREEGVDKDLILLLHFDLGLFLFFLSFLPEVLGFAAKLLSILGFKGDREKGFNYLDKVAHSDCIRSPFAYSIITAKYLYMSENVFPLEHSTSNLANAIQYIDEAMVSCPEGLGFLTLKGICLRRIGKHNDACIIFEDISKRYADKNVDNSLPTIHHGNSFFNMLEWEKANELYLKVEASDTYLRTYTASMFRGVCQLMLGDMDNAHLIMQNALKQGKNDSDFKSFVERYGNNCHLAFWEILVDRDELIWENEEHLNTAQEMLKDFQKQLGINSKDKGETELTKKLKHNKKTKEINACIYHFCQAKFDKYAKNTKSAINNFTKVMNVMKPKTTFEKNMFWQAHFECADLQYKEGNKSEAINIFKKMVKETSSARFKTSGNEALEYIQSH